VQATVDVRLESEEWRPRNISASIGTAYPRWGVYLNYFRSANLLLTLRTDDDPFTREWRVDRHSISLDSRVRLTRHWALHARGLYSILDTLMNDSFLELSYGAQCWGVSIGAGLAERRLNFLDPESEIDRNLSVGFTIHLLNLGGIGGGIGSSASGFATR
jgi:hypothetical protein